MAEKWASEPGDTARKYGLDQVYPLHLSVIHENISRRRYADLRNRDNGKSLAEDWGVKTSTAVRNVHWKGNR
jgi:hypothetical protein